MKQMKTFKDLYHKNKGWWDSFTSCFIGTLLGIGITFAISDYIATKDKKDLERRIQLMSVASMDKSLSALRSEMDKYTQDDSIFTAYMDYYPDSIEYIPSKLSGEFFSAILSFRFYTMGHTASNLLNTNIEVLKSIDNPATISIFSDVFAIQDQCTVSINELEEIKNELQYNINDKKSIFNVDNDKEANRYFFSNNRNIMLLMKFRMYVHTINLWIPMNEEMIGKIKHNLNISDEDLKSYYDESYDLDGKEENEKI